MSVPGEKTLEITYEENGITKMASINIIVNDIEEPTTEPSEEPTTKPANKKAQTIKVTKSYSKKYGDKAFSLNAKLSKGDDSHMEKRYKCHRI